MSVPERLEDLLARQRADAWAARSPEERRARAEAVTAVERAGIPTAALTVGDAVPRFTLNDASGVPAHLDALLRAGPVVISFYRGGWCPYCNLELRALQQRLPELAAAGVTLVAISPELPDRSLSVQEKNGLDFPVLSDTGNEIARAFGLVHAIAPEVVAYQRRNGNDVAAYNGADSAEVPLPATYVVDPGGTVRFAFVDADYTRRADPDEVVGAARASAAR
jgi:peroxiredoxin